VEVRSSGMCGSDLHFYRAPHNPEMRMERRIIGGHEPSGIIAAVGRACPHTSPELATGSWSNHTTAARHVCIAVLAGPQLCNPAHTLGLQRECPRQSRTVHEGARKHLDPLARLV